MTISNIIQIEGHEAVVSYDPESNLLRGAFLGLNGGADFCANSISQLRKEGSRSLRIFLEVCAERGIEPRRQFSGRLNLRLKKTVHEKATAVAAARGISLNALIEEAVEHRLDEVA